MKYNITQNDKDMLLQSSLQYKYRLLVIDKNGSIIDELSSLQVVGSYTIDAESDIRRTTSFTMFLDHSYRDYSVEQKLYEWIGCSFELQIGLYSIRNEAFTWYHCGYYLITSANTSYNAVTNSISTDLSDWFARLNGTRNGQIGGAPTISFPNKDAAGNAVTIKQTTEALLKKGTDISNYLIEDVGAFYGMPQNNADYLAYRSANPDWNQLPYNLTYEAGCTVEDILSEINELYPNCQMYFDIYGNFCFNLIPSCEYDMIALDNDFIQNILLGDNSESVSYNIENIKNVTEVFGQTYSIDRYAACSTMDNVYHLSLELYEDYSDGEMIAFVPDTVMMQKNETTSEELQSKEYVYQVEVKDYIEDTLTYHYTDTFTVTTNQLIGGYIYTSGNYEFVDFYQTQNDGSISLYWSSREHFVGNTQSTGVGSEWTQFYYSYLGDEADEITVTTTIPLFHSKTELDNYLNGGNDSGISVKINELDSIPLYYEYTTNFVDKDVFEAGETYVIKLKKNLDGYFIAYYLGQYQPHALCVLTDNLEDAYYTKAYFAAKYNCKENNITLREEKDSPFTIQKIGEILDVKTGDEFDNILSDSVAMENAIYFNRKSSSINETVTIHTKMMPFLDVNEKIEYKKQQEDSAAYYIVQSISNDTGSNTSSIVMRKFYPLYYS